MTEGRGRLGWYVASFVLLIGAALTVVLTSIDLDVNITALWVSIGLGIAAIAAAIAAIGLPRRR